MKYVGSEDIVAEVKNKLSMYFENGKLDDAFMYRHIRLCLYKMGYKVLPLKREVLDVKDGVANLPNDFHKMTLARACFKGYYEVNDPRRGAVTIVDKPVCELNLCETVCDVCTDECGNMFKLVQQIDTHSTAVYEDFVELSVDKESLPFCAEGCFNRGVKCKDKITIRNGRIYTNFDSGVIYLEYYSTLETEEGYQIPDNEVIINWIITVLVKEGLEQLYFMGEEVLQKLQYSQSELSKAEVAAQNLYRRKEVKEYYEMANLLERRYNMIGRAVSQPVYKYAHRGSRDVCW